MSFISLLLYTFLTHISPIEMDEIRQLFSISNKDENANLKLIKLTKDSNLKTDPLLFAYHAGAQMSMANHVYWPGTKLAYFNEGKADLEKAVNFALTNVEIRFIRYCVQFGAPSMLGYSSNLSEDKKYILKNIDKSNWSAKYKKEVIEFLNQS